MAFTLNNKIVFIDRMLFMNSSLDKLVKKLSDKDFKYFSEKFHNKQLRLVKEKGVYPYEYMDAFKKFNETKLPDIDKCFSSLKDCGISEKEYNKANNIWEEFKIKNLGSVDDKISKLMIRLIS